MADLKWRTLPLFDKEDRPAEGAPQARRKQRSALEQTLHVYWSAGVEGHALGALARRAAYADEQRALLQLQRMEEDRKALAATLLQTIWRVELPGSSTAVEPRTGAPWDSSLVA